MLTRILTALIVLTLVASAAALASGMGTEVTLHKTSHGKVLATSKGLTLYLSTADGTNKSNCTGSCASIWAPLKTPSQPVAGMGVKQSLLGKIKRGKSFQVTYNKHPLYTFASDTKPGQANGEGVEGFFVVNAAGNKK